MRFPIAWLVALTFTGCYPAQPSRRETVEKAAVPHLEVSQAKAQPAATPPRATVRNVAGITFEGVDFDSRNHRLVVADQPGGLGSRYVDAASAAQALGGIAGINAGFFTPEGAPLGLVITSGKISGSWNSASSLGSGVWHENSVGKSAIIRREKLGHLGAAAMRELIQAGPLLVENKHTVSGLEATKSSARTVILWDGATRWWIGCSTPCTLAALGEALATGSPSGWQVHGALNLDGGRSSDVWVSASVTDGPINKRPSWNHPVRNFLVLVAK